MRQDKLTTKLQEALADAQSLAVGNENQYIEPVHLLSALLTRYQQLPDAQRVPEFDAAFGRTSAQLQQALDKLYAGTKLGEEAERLSRFAAAREGKPVAADPLTALAAALVPTGGSRRRSSRWPGTPPTSSRWRRPARWSPRTTPTWSSSTSATSTASPTPT